MIAPQQKFEKSQHANTNEDEFPSSGLFEALLSSLVRGPACGSQLGHSRQGVTSPKLIDGFMEVPSGIDAKEDAVVHQDVHNGEALATPLRASEKEIFVSDSKVADSSFAPTIQSRGQSQQKVIRGGRAACLLPQSASYFSQC